MDLLTPLGPGPRHREGLEDGAVLLRGWLGGREAAIMEAIGDIARRSPFRMLTTPGGRTMSVAMTGCGTLGWHSDRQGYRYVPVDPTTGRPWPAMPELLSDVAREAADEAGYASFAPDACLINRYAPGARLSLHQDRDEDALSEPIVSLSVGVAATFLWGGLERSSPTRRIRLDSGDVVVWGGPSRLVYHGVAALARGWHPLTGDKRFNVTFRAVRRPAPRPC
ncbi:DNA repair protein for alkylated DNA [Ameyamaea chiangmaiensis NBRC 103196]|uniref:DNA oxidative demethylase AlkB n=1 Tax=Ameyamaea chiangmaiensis TaxID=442969 RepID=A0A850PCL6_9PROT|nr:DNA oxidative demethylase AlkB [Ameyamaea chiangmaiensis]MBS4076235.1 DNA oxidative demethylase AlkB [Ameyamaea chiangmaiensis]NVN39692.1 DNA oxidative demethylase AlkB [Ameyamaea chiangmaiensis]GBQ64661.1 DNA repair protein for alkylated DNA [Ameyamaea chiangmaiensis NBRC 103196]